MQSLALLVLALVAVPAASSSVSAHGALSAARAWLRGHSGSPDELAALKGANPEAYALVKALLTKRSMGLLDSKHPSASFSKAEKPREETVEQSPEVFSFPKAEKPQEETVEQSPQVFEQFDTPDERQHAHLSLVASPVSVPYGEVQHAAQQDWLNWKPQTSMDDNTMVQNVLETVAQLKPKQAGFMSTRSSVEVRSSKNSFAAAVEKELPRPILVKPTVLTKKIVKPTVPAKKKSGWMDFSMMTDDQSSPDYRPLQELQAPPVAAATPVKENSLRKRHKPDAPQVVSEWKMLTVEPAEATPPKKLQLLKVASSVAAGPSYLKSFSWEKDDDAQPTKAVPRHISPQALKKLKKKAQLLGWLGVVEKAPAPKIAWAKVVQAPAESNHYMLTKEWASKSSNDGTSNHYMLDLAD